MKTILMAGLVAASLHAPARHAHGGAPVDAPAGDWSHAPRLLPAGGGRGEVMLRLADLQATELTVFAPGATGGTPVRRVPVAAGRAGITPAAPMLGNYHWVQARDTTGGTIRVATTAVYFANPGPAPTALLAESRSELEIVPTPLPREHAHYREGERWRFVVRWQGRPLAGQPVTMETSRGSRARAISAADGQVVFIFPRDVDPGDRDAGGPGRPGAVFVLWTERRLDGVHYLTSFTGRYSPEPGRTRSLPWGTGFALFGMVLALPLLRRRETRHD
ncbi:hypothetical protein G3580_16075 [Nitrogeniibacter mangrovi]|uniref:Uncharacterized protein n=1 Tax=Nitrogeniibacter mangrovi TaxID=2016596 RepID=A0A6C1B5N4_9RHOO|nr:hypothetical protein [Nitrogeniibacter mangrovi]QID19001.1 hypothetical protein G3580_16075 [Nitrogeniibacter mangrovi]